MGVNKEMIPAVGPNWKRVGASLSVSTQATPQRTACASLSIDHTPQGLEIEQFKYFCPLCMLYFRDVLTTSCCSNYVCYGCALQCVRGKHGVGASATSIPARLSADQECMHCRTSGLKLAYAQSEDLVRSYDDSPNTKKLLMRIKASAEPDCSCIEEAEDSWLESIDSRKVLKFGEAEDPRVEVDESAFVEIAEPQFVSPGRSARDVDRRSESPNPATDSIDSGIRSPIAVA